jgi:hypothetical protein
MASGQSGRSPELDNVREPLFPNLPAEEGWARIENAIKDAADRERIDRIEAALAAGDFYLELIAAVRDLVEKQPDSSATTDDDLS